MILADISNTATLTFPVINFIMLVCLMGSVLWHFRSLDIGNIWEEIEALKFRLGVQEKISPCPHCRDHHSIIAGPEADCDC